MNVKNEICGIYKITNPKGFVYIGQSINIDRRKTTYRLGHCKRQTKIYNSIKKYGWESHSFEILKVCDEQDLEKFEKHYIKIFDSFNIKTGLNLTTGGRSYPIHKRKEIGEILKVSLKGKKSYASPFKGKKLPEEWRKNISLSLIGNKRSLGRKLSEEEIEKIRERSKKIGFPQSARELSIKSRSIKIYQYTKDGVFIKEWPSANVAEKSFGNKHGKINYSTSKRDSCAYGFLWKYSDGRIQSYVPKIPRVVNPERIKKIEERKRRYAEKLKINQYSIDGELIKTWRRVIDVSLFFGITVTSINSAVSNGYKCCGFLWKREPSY